MQGLGSHQGCLLDDRAELCYAGSVTASSQISPNLVQMVSERFGTNAKVERCAAMAGDASSRRYVRAWLTGDDAPATLVAMVMEDAEAAKLSDEIGGENAGDEIPYVNVHHFLVACGVAVPELYVDASEEGVLLLEDIGDRALWDAVATAPPDEVRRLFGLAIEQLLRIQLDSIGQGADRCIGFARNFDRSLYEWEFEHFLEWGFTGRLDGSLPKADLDVLRGWFAELSSFLGEQPRVLNHRDFHAWNLFVADGRIRVIDFQDALLAAAPYDLATLLGDRVTPEAVTPEIERDLVAEYGRLWNQHPRAPWQWQGDALWRVYRACAIQKACKVVGRFHFLNEVKGKPGYLKFLPPTLERIRGLLDDSPQWSSAGDVLRKYFPELRS